MGLDDRTRFFGQIGRRWMTAQRPGLAILIMVLLAVSAASTAAQDEPPVVADQPSLHWEDPGENPVLQQTVTATGATIDLLPVQDTFTTSGLPDTNWGNDQSLRLGYNQGGQNRGAERAYIQWDIDYVPGNIIIHSAELWTYKNFVTPADDQPMGVIMRHLNSPWNANTLTWNSNLPEWGGVALEGEITSSLGWNTLDVRTIVQQWVSGERPNYGLVVIGDETPQERERAWFSRNGPADLRPFLRIEYSFSTDTTPPTANIVPFSSPYSNLNTFDVSWTGSDTGGSGISHFGLQYRRNGSDWIDWLANTTNTTAAFTGDDGLYEFRVRATDNANNVGSWSAAESITVDTIAPYSYIVPFTTPTINVNTFLVQWMGTDGDGSSLTNYDLRYRLDNGSWVLWQSQTTAVSAIFIAPRDGHYQFEVRARDNAGNVGEFLPSTGAGIIVDQAGLMEKALWLPSVLHLE